MARLRAVVTIQAPGLGGWPSAGHLATATVNASCTASSAASISPRKRIRVATQRPYSRRKTASTVTAREPMVAARMRSPRVGRVFPDRVVEVPFKERTDLDRPLFRDRGEPGPLKGRVQVGDVDDPEPGEVFLGLGVRPVSNQEVITGLAHHGRRLRATAQAALEHERTGVGQFVAQRVYPGPHLAASFRGNDLVIGLVEGEQVLRHYEHSRLSSGAGLWPTLIPATKWPPPKSTPRMPRCQKSSRRGYLPTLNWRLHHGRLPGVAFSPDGTANPASCGTRSFRSCRLPPGSGERWAGHVLGRR